MIKRIKHLFGVHDVVYYNDGLWGRCVICGKLFGKSPLIRFAEAVRRHWAKRVELFNKKYFSYDNLKENK